MYKQHNIGAGLLDTITVIIDFLLQNKLLLTALLIVLISLFKQWLVTIIRGNVAFLTDKQRKWISRSKNGIFLLTITILFMLWQTEVSKFALSVTAIAIAFVVASKEIILCFTGSIQRASSRSFVIGDWIEVGNIYGQVIEHNLMATVIQEIDLVNGQYHFTGKTATLPNSMFFTYAVKNHNFMKRYVYHHMTITVAQFVDLYPLLPELTRKIESYCEDFIEVAKRYNSMIEKHAGVDLPGSEPHIHITSGATGEQHVNIMIFCPTERAIALDSKIRQDFMQAFEQHFKQSA